MSDKKTVLVTGGRGFIGSHIIDALVEMGEYYVVCLDSANPTNIFDGNPSCEYEKGDIYNEDQLYGFFYNLKPDYIIHCAALARIQPSFKIPRRYCEVNVQGTVNILEMARNFGVKKVVYSSSSSVYGNATKMPLKETFKPRPLNPYAASKLMGEMWVYEYARSFGLPACSLRYFNVYGERQPTEGQYATVVGIFLRQLAEAEEKGGSIVFTIVPPGTQKRDFTWVGDVAKSNILAMLSGDKTNGHVFNIGTGVNVSITKLAGIVGNGHNYSLKKIDKRSGEAKLSSADYSKAKKMLGWKPKVCLEDGVNRLKKNLKTG